MKHIFKCQKCNKFTMKELCTCGNKTLSVKPVKYSPNDKFESYKRKARIDDYKKRGLI